MPSLNAQVRRAVVVAAVAVAANLAVYGLARALGVSLVIPSPADEVPTQLPIGAVIAASVVGIALAAVTLGLLRHFAPERAPVAFPALVAIFTAVSLSAPLGLDTGAANKLVLATMHVVTAVAAVVGLPWRHAATPV